MRQNRKVNQFDYVFDRLFSNTYKHRKTEKGTASPTNSEAIE